MSWIYSHLALLLVSTPPPNPPPKQRLVMSLHILLQYFCAYVQLGGHTHGEMGGAWGGKEGIGIVIIEICSIEISYFKKSINCWRIQCYQKLEFCPNIRIFELENCLIKYMQ